MASSSAFTIMAPSAVLILTAPSATATVVETSFTVEVDPLMPDVLGAVDATTHGSGHGALAALGACCPDSGVHWLWTHH
jgi:hypothetical protein